MLFLPPPHRADINLATLQQSPLRTSRSSFLLIRHGAHILARKRTYTSVEVEFLHFLPNRQNIVRVQRNTIRDTPEETKRNHARFSRHRITARRGCEESVGVEDDVVPVQQQTARKVAAGEDGGHAVDLLREDGRVGFGEEVDFCSRGGAAFEPFGVWGADDDGAGEGARPVGPGGVVVWVGDYYGVEAAEGVDLVRLS